MVFTARSASPMLSLVAIALGQSATLGDEVEVVTITTAATTGQTVDIDIRGTTTYRIDWGDGTEQAGVDYAPHQYADGAASHDIVIYSRSPNSITEIDADRAFLTQVTFALDLPQLQVLNMPNNQLTGVNI